MHFPRLDEVEQHKYSYLYNNASINIKLFIYTYILSNYIASKSLLFRLFSLSGLADGEGAVEVVVIEVIHEDKKASLTKIRWIIIQLNQLKYI